MCPKSSVKALKCITSLCSLPSLTGTSWWMLQPVTATPRMPDWALLSSAEIRASCENWIRCCWDERGGEAKMCLWLSLIFALRGPVALLFQSQSHLSSSNTVFQKNFLPGSGGWCPLLAKESLQLNKMLPFLTWMLESRFICYSSLNLILLTMLFVR